jgi:hypothetical protein
VTYPVISALTLRETSDDECYAADENAIRALLVRHGYDPDRRPLVCELDGVPVGGHEDRGGVCIHCGRVIR